MLVFDYGQRKAKLDADDAKGFLAWRSGARRTR